METRSDAVLPEEEELAAKREQLAQLQGDLVDAELELATLQAELHDFERAYLAKVGVRLAELDRIEADIAEALARRHPEDLKAASHAERAQAQAKESTAAFPNDGMLPTQPAPFKPSDELRAIYIQVAKAIHPDLITNENERARRHRYMAAANEAYQDGDIERLKSILNEWRSSPEAVPGEGPAAELVRAIRQIAQIRSRLARVTEQLDAMRRSDIFRLWTQAVEYEAAGMNLLQVMAEKVDAQIARARQRLEGTPSIGRIR